HGVSHNLGIVGYRLRQAADAPSQGQVDGDVVYLLRRVVEIQGMDAARVLTHVLLGSTKETNRHEDSTACRRDPTRDFQAELGGHCRRGCGPIRLVCELDFNSNGNGVLYVILEERLATSLILMAFLMASPRCFEARVDNNKLAFQGAFVRQLEVGLAK